MQTAIRSLMNRMNSKMVYTDQPAHSPSAPPETIFNSSLQGWIDDELRIKVFSLRFKIRYEYLSSSSSTFDNHQSLHIAFAVLGQKLLQTSSYVK